jgi:hypothetical protein
LLETTIAEERILLVAEAPVHKSGRAETDFSPLSPELATISYSTLTLNYV